MIKLLGVQNTPIPYIPLCERDSDNPTVFWVKGKTVGLVHRSSTALTMLELPDGAEAYSDFRQVEFLACCDKIENFYFSENMPDLHKAGLFKKISDKKLLQIVLNELDPTIFNEVMNFVDEISVVSSPQKHILELITYFALYKNDEMPIHDRLSYSCNNCQVMKSYEGRICWLMNDSNQVKLPVMGEQVWTGEYETLPELEETFLTSEEFIHRFDEIASKALPLETSFRAFMQMQSLVHMDKEICITGLPDDTYLKVLEWAIDCKQMQSLPYEGSYFDQPNQLIDCFKIVNSTISEFERIKMDSLTKKGKGR